MNKICFFGLGAALLSSSHASVMYVPCETYDGCGNRTTISVPVATTPQPAEPMQADKRKERDAKFAEAMESKLVRAVQNGTDIAEGIEEAFNAAPEDQVFILLTAVRQALVARNPRLALDIALDEHATAASHRKGIHLKALIDRTSRGYWVLALSARMAYADIYFFLTESGIDPREIRILKDGDYVGLGQKYISWSVMDSLDQGREEYGDNALNYQRIEDDLTSRGVKLMARADDAGCCNIM